MKHVIVGLLAIVCSVGTLFAQEDMQLMDALDDLLASKQQQQLTSVQEDLSFDTFSSCEDMTSVLETFIKDNFKDNRYGRRGGYIEPFMMDDTMMDMAVEESAPIPMSTKTVAEGIGGAGGDFDTVGSSTTDFSNTNLQVDGVDEADIFKTDGDYMYYYNDKEKKIHILRSPLNRSSATISLADAELIKEIRIPETFWGTQMYITDNKLVFVAQRRSESRQDGFIDKGSRTNIVVYDIADVTNPKLIKLSDLDGNYHDSRMIGDQLYVVSQLQVNRWYPQQIFDTVDDVDLPVDSLLPKSIDIAYTRDASKKNLTIGNTTYPYRVAVEKPDCSDIHYVLPSKESMQEFNLMPSFTVVRSIDINDTTQPVDTTAAFGSTQTIHMSQKGLYLTSPFYMQRAFTCPANARCMLPWYDAGQHTLIHKFDVDSSSVDYKASNLVNGSPLSQYSMSEDNRGFFRILTSTWSPQLATHLFVLDDDLELEGMLMNIEPGEEFKSSRYIGDKLYLVTFEQIDPLFVIDLKNTKKPTIIGELKIPGFSTYLHPYADAANGKQYLLGLGYDTELNQRGGTVTKGIKLDLYEIDYTVLDANGYVSTKQIHTKTWGEQNSYSEATQNPRMFVRDEARKLVILPMILSSSEKAQNCNIQYDSNGNEVSRECWDNDKIDTEFAGLKAINVDITNGISEAYSINFIDTLKKYIEVYEGRDGAVYPWQFSQLHFRVGYLGDVLYTLNNAFAHFTIMDTDQQKILPFSKQIQGCVEEYVYMGDIETCNTIDYICGDEQEYFDNEKGCGCITSTCR